MLKYDGSKWVGAAESGAGGSVTNVTATAPLSVTTGTTTPVISTTPASNSADGYLSSVDWTTFNGKQAALGFTPLSKAGGARALG